MHYIWGAFVCSIKRVGGKFINPQTACRTAHRFMSLSCWAHSQSDCRKPVLQFVFFFVLQYTSATHNLVYLDFMWSCSHIQGCFSCLKGIFLLFVLSVALDKNPLCSETYLMRTLLYHNSIKQHGQPAFTLTNCLLSKSDFFQFFPLTGNYKDTDTDGSNAFLDPIFSTVILHRLKLCGWIIFYLFTSKYYQYHL